MDLITAQVTEVVKTTNHSFVCPSVCSAAVQYNFKAATIVAERDPSLDNSSFKDADLTLFHSVTPVTCAISPGDTLALGVRMPLPLDANARNCTPNMFGFDNQTSRRTLLGTYDGRLDIRDAVLTPDVDGERWDYDAARRYPAKNITDTLLAWCVIVGGGLLAGACADYAKSRQEQAETALAEWLLKQCWWRRVEVLAFYLAARLGKTAVQVASATGTGSGAPELERTDF
jgi:hypothetical protein